MRLVRYGAKGAEKPGVLDGQGQIRDLSGHVADLGPAALSPTGLERLRSLSPQDLPLVAGTPRLGPPVSGVGKIVAIGLNYVDHAAEAGMAIPTEPLVFSKAITSLSGPDDDVVLPPGAVKGDWEVELGVVIGSRAAYVAAETALDHVAGYVLVNDVSERAYQLERGGSWDKGKGCDTFCPIGPWLVTRDDIADPQDLALWLEVNGQRRQAGHTRSMIFSVAQLVAYVSQFMTLQPGDLIITGTPAGVGIGAKPPVFLKAGDTMHLGGDGLGEQRQRVVAFSVKPEGIAA